MTSSTRYLVEAGSTSPETRLMTIKPNPKASRARRGRIRDQISGSALKTGVFGFTDFAGFSAIQLCIGFAQRLVWVRKTVIKNGNSGLQPLFA